TANVWVAHSQRTLNFRREPWLESWLCRLDGNASAQLAIEGFIDHAHSAFSDVANDFEALRDYFSGLKCGRGVFERDCGMKEERTHPFLPFYDIASFLQQVGIIGAGLSQVGLSLRRGLLQGRSYQLHQALIAFGAAFHFFALRRLNNQQ